MFCKLASHLELSVSSIVTSPLDLSWFLTRALIDLSLVNNNVMHLYICFFDNLSNIFRKVLSKYFAHFSFQLSFGSFSLLPERFLMYSGCKTYIRYKYCKYCILLSSVACYFTHLTVAFDKQKFLISCDTTKQSFFLLKYFNTFCVLFKDTFDYLRTVKILCFLIDTLLFNFSTYICNTNWD